MKHIHLLLFVTTFLGYTQVTPPANLQSYYNGVDFNKTGLNLFNDLANKTSSKHTNFLSYTPGIWEASKFTDEDPNNSNNVLLIYGYNDSGSTTVHRSRSKNSNGGNSGDWNREHTYPKSLGNPNLGTVGPGADAHHLRPSDVQMNANRGNKKYIDGSGFAGSTSGGWYPGDEWKGDVARMMMYMYLRYGSRCLPSNVTIGATNNIDTNMIDLLLEWNAQDPVSAFEDNRNTYHSKTSNTYAQGNRNPFIDNPYLATIIWGGTPAENRWENPTTPDNEAPTTPTNLTASNPTATTVNLNWTASSDNLAVTTYNVYVNNNFYASTNSSSTSYIVTGLAPETLYSFAVLAKDAANNTSTLSNIVNQTTLASGSNNNGNNCINETFENIPANASNYTTRTWAGNDGGTWTATDARTDQNLNNRSICIRNGSLTSPTISGGIGNLTVTMQSTFSSDSSGNFTLLVNGNAVGNIPYNKNSSTTTTISNINISGNVTVVLENQSSSNRVRIDDVSWTCHPSLSTKKTQLNNVKIHPNPIKMGSYLNIETSTNITVNVFNVMGTLIVSNNVNPKHNKIQLKKLHAGIYILQLFDGLNASTKKLIIE